MKPFSPKEHIYLLFRVLDITSHFKLSWPNLSTEQNIYFSLVDNHDNSNELPLSCPKLTTCDYVQKQYYSKGTINGKLTLLLSQSEPHFHIIYPFLGLGSCAVMA